VLDLDAGGLPPPCDDRHAELFLDLRLQPQVQVALFRHPLVFVPDTASAGVDAVDRVVRVRAVLLGIDQQHGCAVDLDHACDIHVPPQNTQGAALADCPIKDNSKIIP
jgi:hypothetical protein